MEAFNIPIFLRQAEISARLTPKAPLFTYFNQYLFQLAKEQSIHKAPLEPL